jgi:hypothetical protein
MFSHLTTALTALSAVRGTLFGASISQQIYDRLDSSTESVLKNESYPEILRLAKRAALRKFNEAEGDNRLISHLALQQEFTCNLVWALTERRCLSQTRERIMNQSQRDTDAQFKREAELQRLLLEPCGPLGKALLSETPKVIRAPKRQFKPNEMTLETLHQPLQVLGK